MKSLKTKKSGPASTLSQQGGFTLAEVIVTMGIFAVISLVVITRFSLFNSTVATTNLAYDIALSIRQAQTFGLNVRGFDPGGPSNTFDTGFGIRFDRTSPASYIFFGDINKDNQYQIGEVIEVFNLGGGNVISDICGVLSDSSEECTSTLAIDEIDIVFTRPDPEAVIRSYTPTTVYQRVKVYLTSPKGVERMIVAESTGQIAIQDSDK